MKFEQLSVKTEEIRERRKSLGKTVTEVAKEMGISTCLYSFKETGRTQFSEREKYKLAEILGFTLEEINDILLDNALPAGTIEAKEDKL